MVLTPANATINGNSTFTLAGGSATAPVFAALFSDGTNYIVKTYTGAGGGGSVTATSVQSALTSQSNCNAAGYVYSPQSNTCVAVGSSVTATSVQSALASQSNCNAAGYVYSPQSNTCVAVGSSVTATSVQSALTSQSNCDTAGYVYSPQSNTCVAVESSVTATSVQSALTSQSNCNTAGYVYSPQSNTCVAGAAPITAAAPYLQIGSTYYIPADSMFAATPPNGLSGWSAGTIQTGTVTNLANQSTTYEVPGGTLAMLQAPSPATNTIEVSGTWANEPGTNGNYGSGGIYVYDSTNQKVYVLELQYDTTYDAIAVRSATWKYSGPGNNASFYANNTAIGSPLGGRFHFKASVAGTSLTFFYSTDGGASFIPLPSVTVGTIGGMGIFAQYGILNLFSVTHS